jgi:rSAM/selenodomain-associated transferase 1
MENALVIMAKAPLPGESKTRLASTFSPEGAAELSRCFFLDAMELAQHVRSCEVILAYSPADSLENFPIAGREFVESIHQGQGDLGVRMRHVFEILFDKGYSRVVLIGTDMPTLPLSYLQEAFSLLEDHPVVLGPSLDGGYYLIGLQAMLSEIFEDIDWGSNQVYSQTVERLELIKIKPTCLLPWYDVDTLEDLGFLITHLNLLRSCTDERLPEHTLAFLEREGFLSEGQSMVQVGNG